MCLKDVTLDKIKMTYMIFDHKLLKKRNRRNSKMFDKKEKNSKDI